MIPVITKEQLWIALFHYLPTNDFGIDGYRLVAPNIYGAVVYINNGFNVTFNDLYEGIRNSFHEIYVKMNSPYSIGLNQLGLASVNVEDSMKWTFTMQFEVSDESDNLETDDE